MKHLELQLQKRLLIVEHENGTQAIIYAYNKYGALRVKMICKGTEFTEEIAKKLIRQSIHTKLFAHHVEGIPVNIYCYKTALESFISAIEAKGYHWGENPVNEPTMEEYGWYSSCSPIEDSGWMYEEGEKIYYEALKQFDDAESRTFNLDKTLIFEIL